MLYLARDFIQAMASFTSSLWFASVNYVHWVEELKKLMLKSYWLNKWKWPDDNWGLVELPYWLELILYVLLYVILYVHGLKLALHRTRRKTPTMKECFYQANSLLLDIFHILIRSKLYWGWIRFFSVCLLQIKFYW